MSVGKTPSKIRKTYKFIEAHRDEFSIQAMCRILCVARAGYYAWLDHPVSGTVPARPRECSNKL